MRILVESDGTPTGTRVTDQATGQELRCSKVVISMEPQRVTAEVTLLVVDEDVKFNGHLEVFKSSEAKA